MDKTAIEQIQKAHTTAAINQQLVEMLGVDTGALFAPNDFKLHDLERMLPYRRRYRGEMVTNSVDSFVKYSSEYANPGAQCFVSHKAMCATVVFDVAGVEGPGHCEFFAKLSLEPTVEYKAAMAFNESYKNQRELAEWLEDWQEFISVYDEDGNTIQIKKAISIVRRIDIERSRKEEHEEGSFRSQKSALESIEAKSVDKLPAGFTFVCAPYNAITLKTIDFRLSLLTDKDSPRFVARIKRLDMLKDDISNEFKQLIEDSLEDSIPTYIGERSF